MNRLLNGYFGVLLLVSALLGLVIPMPRLAGPLPILMLLFLMIFASFFQLELHPAGSLKSSALALLFSITRFLLLPLLVYYCILPFSKSLAFAFFFLALMPPGNSSPAIGRLLGGNFTFSIILLVLSNALVIFSVSLLSPLFARQVLVIDAAGLFRTLLLTIILPFLLHLPLRRISRFSHWMKGQVSVIVLLSLSVLLFLVVARNSNAVLHSLSRAPVLFFLALLFFLMQYAAGWSFLSGRGRELRISGSIGSGLTNIGLAVSLSTLYLSPDITLLFIYGEFAWVVALILWRRFLSFHHPAGKR